MMYTMHYDSPLGGILLAADEEGLTGLWFETQKYFAAKLAPEHEEKMTPALDAALPLAGCLFFGSGAGLHAEAPSRRLGFPAGGVGAAAEDPLRPDHDLRRAGGTAGRAKRKARLGTGGGRRCGAQPRLPHRACHGWWAAAAATGYAGGVEKKMRLLTLENSEAAKFYR